MFRRIKERRLAAKNFSAVTRLAQLALIALSLSPAWAQTSNSYDLNKDHSRIRFSIGHFFVSSTEGQFTNFDGKMSFPPQTPERGAVTIHIAPGSISTGNGARDDHLRTADFFDAATYPTATFENSSLVRLSSTTGKVTGSLSLHGVTRPITLNVTLRSPDLNADRLDFSADTVLKRSDYGMTNYLGVIGDEVTLTIEAEFDKER